MKAIRLPAAWLISLSLLAIPGGGLALASGNNTDTAGLSAARPGLATVSQGTSTGHALGLGGQTARHAIDLNAGAGKKWCAKNSGYTLGANYKNVYACGPANGPADAFDTAGFQCVELSERFLWVTHHEIIPYVPDGKDLVSLGGSELGITIGTPATGVVPAAGDIVSLWGGPNAEVYGHTAVVTSVDVDSSGDGTIEIMEQNGLQDGWDQIQVSHWVETYGDPNYAGGIYYYTHIDWLELAPTSGPPPPTTKVQYDVQGLGSGTTVKGINAHGVVTGLTTRVEANTRIHRPFLYENGHYVGLRSPRLRVSQTESVGINNNGVVAAWAKPHQGKPAGYAVPTRKLPTWLKLPAPNPHAMVNKPTSIDAQGDVSGWASSGDSYTPSVGVEWMRTPHGYHVRRLSANHYFSRPVVTHADHWGDAIGSEMLGTTKTFAVVWAPWSTGYRLPGLSHTPSYTVATAMSEKMTSTGRDLTIIGTSTTPAGIREACEWRVSVTPHWLQWGNAIPLGVPGGFTSSSAKGINGSGWVVGNLTKSSGAPRAFLWRPGIGMTPLTTMTDRSSGWILTRAVGVNTSGEVIGQGYDANTSTRADSHGVVLTPITVSASAPPSSNADRGASPSGGFFAGSGKLHRAIANN